MTLLVWLLAAMAGLLLAFQLAVWWRSRQSQGRVAPDTRAVDGEAALAPLRVYYFYAEHCGACRATTPLVGQLRTEHPHLIALDIHEAPELARAFGVVATPGFYQVIDGVIRRVRIGGVNASQLRALLAND